MKRFRYLLLLLVAISAGALIFTFTRPDAKADERSVVAGPTAPASAPAKVAAVSPGSTPSATATKTTAQWIADTASGEATTRATAIIALAEAPRADALPVLSRILTDGEPLVDRPLALTSLRELALNQGDADGAIRDAVRHVIYHGDDFTKVDDAQDTLDIIEESLMRQ
ncbi:MAG: hypothetical protein ABUL69_01570 [Peristeroidobacter soli]